MINSLRGKVLSTSEESITLEVSGFGLEVFSSRSLMSQASLSEELFCFAYMQVSDAGISLFGFSDERETYALSGTSPGQDSWRQAGCNSPAPSRCRPDPAGYCIRKQRDAYRARPGCKEGQNAYASNLKIRYQKNSLTLRSFGAQGQKDHVSDSFVMEALTGAWFHPGRSHPRNFKIQG